MLTGAYFVFLCLHKIVSIPVYSLDCAAVSAMLHWVSFRFRLRYRKMADETTEPTATGKRVALGVTGGIAAYKAAEVLRGLQRAGCTVRVAMSPRACEFVTPLTFRALSGSHVIVDDYAPDNPDPIAILRFPKPLTSLLLHPRRQISSRSLPTALLTIF